MVRTIGILFCLFFGLGQSCKSLAQHLLMGAPPDLPRQEAERIFRPITDMLSNATGLTISYEYPRHHSIYDHKIRRGEYDLIFDQAHVTGWSAKQHGFTPLVRFTGLTEYMLVSRKSDNRIIEYRDLAGHMVCSSLFPRLPAAWLMSLYRNTYRRPQILDTVDVPLRYQGLLDSRCKGAVLPGHFYKTEIKQDAFRVSRVLSYLDQVPRHSFSASAKVPQVLFKEIVDVMLSESGSRATRNLRNFYANGSPLVEAALEEFMPFAEFLEEEWNFGL